MFISEPDGTSKFWPYTIVLALNGSQDDRFHRVIEIHHWLRNQLSENMFDPQWKLVHAWSFIKCGFMREDDYVLFKLTWL